MAAAIGAMQNDGLWFGSGRVSRHRAVEASAVAGGHVHGVGQVAVSGDCHFDFEEQVMNRTRLLLIGFVALALGAVVSYSVYRTLQTRDRAPTHAPGVEVVVAANDIAVGAKVGRERREAGALFRRRSARQRLSPENLRRGTGRNPSHRQRRIFPAQQTGGRKCRGWNAVSDSAGNAGGFGAGE